MRSRIVLLTLLAGACSGPAEPNLDAGADDAGRPDAQPVDPCEADPTAPGCAVDPCEEAACEGAERECTVEEGAAVCRCMAGSHEADGACVPDVECMAGSCNEHGACTSDGTAIDCACERGYEGEFCSDCDRDGGFLPDGAGGCDDDLCDPNPCGEGERSRCEVVDEVATCACPAGTHDEDGGCVPDADCSPTSCGGHGTCTDSGPSISCACEDGWAEPFCGGCDELAGYHSDGAGGCTTDVCLPNPCTGPLETVCTVVAGLAQCACDAGAHLEGMICVADEVCESGTCSMRGSCAVVDGRTECTCSAGYADEDCGACAAGYHDDGAGACTDDPCAPNPCTMPNRGACSGPVGGAATCACDPDYHEDGVGGCTADPCTPDPCAALGQACRLDTLGMAECYTPVCDDMNPCTDDAFEAGGCVHTGRADGSSCSDTVCTSGQICTSGTCGGGAPVDCADSNPCTADTCHPIDGCLNTNDDALVPDDGYTCTADSCSDGVEEHVPTDSVCDDLAYCNGVETCSPSSSGADSDGCLDGEAPSPPGPSHACRYYAACDEGMDSFPLIVLGAGASCDDAIRCTSGDVCLTEGGACAGTPVASCPDAACTTTIPWSSTVDIVSADVTGTITLGGAALPANDSDAYNYGEAYLYLVPQDGGARHILDHVDYDSSRNLIDDQIDARVIPGIYDLLYRRSYNRNTSQDEWVSLARPTANYPTGDRILSPGLVIAARPNVLSVDIPAADVTGTITLGGAALPANDSDAYNYGEAYLYLVPQDGGARHILDHVDYDSSRNLIDDQIDARVPPGTYDLLYRRSYNRNSSQDEWVSIARPAANYPTGDRVLSTGIVVTAGANT
ncbi:MAG: hypothetical protein AB8I08_40810, partial [Sandaracinaceae bacterium]